MSSERQQINSNAGIHHTLSRQILGIDWYATESSARRVIEWLAEGQEPVAWAGAIEYGVPLLMVEPQNWKATPLCAAPVSEAKAQGVEQVQWHVRYLQAETVSDGWWQDSSEQRAAWCAEANQQQHAKGLPDTWEIRRFTIAAHVQQVSVPDWWRELLRDIEQFFEGAGVSPGPDIELRMAAMLAAAPAAPAADAGLVDMYRHLQTVTPYRFKKIQDASVTDGGDVLYFHKDRFDAALLDDMAANCAKESK